MAMDGVRIAVNIELLINAIEQIKRELQTTFETLDKSCQVIFEGCEGDSIVALKEYYEKLKSTYEKNIEYLEAVRQSIQRTAEQIWSVDTQIAGDIRCK